MNDEDYVGKKHGRLTVLEVLYIYQKNRKRKFFKCICDCGKIHITRADGILNKKTFSCGCQKNEKNKGKNYKHFSYGTRLYNIYAGMKQRCYNPNCHCFKRYGKRGIKICSQWLNGFVSFRDWALENGYSSNLTIDRIDVNGDYSPENCRWATIKQQSRNRRTTHLETYGGKTMCLTEWAEHIGINKGTLISGIRRGKTIEYFINKYSKS